MTVPEIQSLKKRIIELRRRETEWLSLPKKDDKISLWALHLTAHGHQILRTLELGLTCTEQEFKEILKALGRLGLSLEVKDTLVSEELSPPSHLSVNLVECILKLVER